MQLQDSIDVSRNGSLVLFWFFLHCSYIDVFVTCISLSCLWGFRLNNLLNMTHVFVRRASVRRALTLPVQTRNRRTSCSYQDTDFITRTDTSSQCPLHPRFLLSLLLIVSWPCIVSCSITNMRLMEEIGPPYDSKLVPEFVPSATNHAYRDSGEHSFLF